MHAMKWPKLNARLAGALLLTVVPFGDAGALTPAPSPNPMVPAVVPNLRSPLDVFEEPPGATIMPPSAEPQPAPQSADAPRPAPQAVPQAPAEAPRTAAQSPAAASSAPAPAHNPLWAVPLSTLTETHARPIFSPSRRPPPPPPPPPVAAPVVARAAPPPPETAKQPDLALVGTVMGDGEFIGIFVESRTKNIVRLRTGEGHDGWTLLSIQGREATLASGNASAILALPATGPNGQPIAAVTTAVAHPAPVAPEITSALPEDEGKQPQRVHQ